MSMSTGDLVNRYSAASPSDDDYVGSIYRAAGTTPPLPLANIDVRYPSAGSARENEEEYVQRVDESFQQAVSEGPDTIMGYVGNYQRTLRDIAGLAAADFPRNYDKIRGLYDELVSVASDSQSQLDEIEMTGSRGGEYAQSIAKDASDLRNANFKNLQIISNGQQTTLGALMESDRPLNRLAAHGFSQAVADAYHNTEDEVLRTAMSWIVDPVISGPSTTMVELPNKNGMQNSVVDSSVPSARHIQFNNYADHVASKFKTARDQLGDAGALALVKQCLQSNAEAGGMINMFDTVVKLTESGTGVGADLKTSGVEFVNGFFDFVDRTLAGTVFSDPQDPEARKLSPSEQRFLTAEVVGAAKECGDNLDFSNPKFLSAARSAASLVAQLHASGNFDLLSAVANKTTPAKFLGDYIKRTMDDPLGRPPPDHAITQLEEVGRGIESMIIAGPVVSAQSAVMTGDRRVYDKDAAKGLTSRSISPEADRALSRVIGIVRHTLAPYILDGDRPDVALSKVLRDRDASTNLRKDLASAFSVGMTGDSGQTLADILSTGILARLMRGNSQVSDEQMPPGAPGQALQFDITGQIAAIALGSEDQMDPVVYSAYSSLKGQDQWRRLRRAATAWYTANVSDVDRFTAERELLKRHYMSVPGGTLSEADAIRASASVITEMNRQLCAGVDPRLIQAGLNAALNSGTVYEPVFICDEKTGQIVTAPERGGRVSSDGKMPQVGRTYSMDPATGTLTTTGVFPALIANHYTDLDDFEIRAPFMIGNQKIDAIPKGSWSRGSAADRQSLLNALTIMSNVARAEEKKMMSAKKAAPSSDFMSGPQ